MIANADMSADDLLDWAIDAARSKTIEIERPEILSMLRAKIQSDPSDGEAHHALAFAIYHLWREIPSERLVEALAACRRAQDLLDDREWAELCEVYLQWCAKSPVGCVVACGRVDREFFRESPSWGWRAISVDEVEFASLVELRMGRDRVAILAEEIVRAAVQEQVGMFPFEPLIFLRALPSASEIGFVSASDAERFRSSLSATGGA